MIPIAVCSVKAALCVFIKWIYKKILVADVGSYYNSQVQFGFARGAKCRFSNRDKAEKSGTNWV